MIFFSRFTQHPVHRTESFAEVRNRFNGTNRSQMKITLRDYFYLLREICSTRNIIFILF